MADIKKKPATKKSSAAKASTAKKSTAVKAKKKTVTKKTVTKKAPYKKVEKHTQSVSSKVKSDESRSWVVTSIVLAIAIILLVAGIGYVLMNNNSNSNDDNSNSKVNSNLNSSASVNSGNSKSSSIQLLILEDPTCTNCNVDTFAQQVKTNLIPQLTVKKVSIQTAEGKKLLSELKLNQVPAYLFSKSIESLKNWSNQLSSAFVPVTASGVSYYMLNPQYVPEKVMITEPKILDSAIVYGNKTAPVTLYEFTDYECPFCAIAEGNADLLAQFRQRSPGYVAPMPQIFKDYIDTGKVKLVFYDMPLEQLHPKVRPAHLAAQCANEQGKWIEFHHKLFADRSDWAETSDYVAKMKGYAKDLGLNTTQFDSCLDSKKYNYKIEQSLAYGKSLGISGTPAFFVDKNFLSGAQDFKAFKVLIDAKLAAAVANN